MNNYLKDFDRNDIIDLPVWQKHSYKNGDKTMKKYKFPICGKSRDEATVCGEEFCFGGDERDENIAL